MSDNLHASFYIAIVLYEARVDDGPKAPLYQESFILLQAPSEEEARRMALA